MTRYKITVVIVVLLTFFATMAAPVAPVQAASLSDLLSQTATEKKSSGSSLVDILLGLLLGKFLGNFINTNSTPDTSTTLGALAAPKTTYSGQALIDTAKKYMGVPYVWGGETPSGFDCSGFTQYVMKQNGIAIPRTAAEQFSTGTPVDKSQLKVGDLVFFTTYKPGASHVGFYMGNGNFIHASSAEKKVTISSLDTQYYKDRYIGARRYQ